MKKLLGFQYSLGINKFIINIMCKYFSIIISYYRKKENY